MNIHKFLLNHSRQEIADVLDMSLWRLNTKIEFGTFTSEQIKILEERLDVKE